MDTFDFFFPEQAQAKQLRRIADRAERAERSQNRQRLKESVTINELTKEVDALKTQVGFLNSLSMVFIKIAVENGLVAIGDISDLVAEVSALDGSSEVGMTQDALRGILGIFTDSDETVDEDDDVEVQHIRRHRRRRS